MNFKYIFWILWDDLVRVTGAACAVQCVSEGCLAQTRAVLGLGGGIVTSHQPTEQHQPQQGDQRLRRQETPGARWWPVSDDDIPFPGPCVLILSEILWRKCDSAGAGLATDNVITLWPNPAVPCSAVWGWVTSIRRNIALTCTQLNNIATAGHWQCHFLSWTHLPYLEDLTSKSSLLHSCG